MPAISVIVPVYRAEETLRACAASVLEQDFTDLELLLIDDGSPDGSGALCDAIAAEDGRVRVFHKPNGGVSSARNLGLREAAGDYIAFADADDWWQPGAFSALYAALTDAGADSAGCGYEKVWPDGARTAWPPALAAGAHEAPALREGIVHRLLGHRLGGEGEVLDGFIWRFLFSRAIIAAQGLSFEGAYLEDELFLMEYFCHARRCVMLDGAYYCYLQNPASVTRNYLPNYGAVFRRFMEQKKALAQRYELDVPGWEAETEWAGLLIAIGNEYAPGSPGGWRARGRRVRELTLHPETAAAIAALKPKGLWKNKQVVADLVAARRFALLTALYAIKNRGR